MESFETPAGLERSAGVFYIHYKNCLCHAIKQPRSFESIVELDGYLKNIYTLSKRFLIGIKERRNNER
jgi:hypothetical protein